MAMALLPLENAGGYASPDGCEKLAIRQMTRRGRARGGPRRLQVGAPMSPFRRAAPPLPGKPAPRRRLPDPICVKHGFEC